jgi:histidine phosphotransferase ChpT
MSESPIEALDLAALLCSRVCHDLISPVGAIVNGLEVLEEEKDEATKEFALDLIKSSAGTASKKLQFCRIAFGAAGSAGAQIDLGDAETISRGFLEDEKTKLAWNLPRALLQKNRVKLLLNMLAIAGQAIPRGGSLTPLGPAKRWGQSQRRRQRESSASCAFAARGESRGPDAHRIQPFYAGLGQGLQAQSRRNSRRRNGRGRGARARRRAEPNRWQMPGDGFLVFAAAP